LSASSYQTIIPNAPIVKILSPSNGGTYKGNLNVRIDLQADGLDSATAYLNGQSIQTFSNNGTLNFVLPTTNYSDGTYQLQVVASQTDGITTSANVTVYFANQYATSQSNLTALNSGQSALQNQIDSMGDQLQGLNASQSALQNQIGNEQGNLQDLGGNLNSSIGALQNQIADLSNNLKTVELLSVVGITIGALGVAIAVAVALSRRHKASAPASP
jgi:hypothetical protein